MNVIESLAAELADGLIFFIFDFVLTFFEALATAVISKLLLASGKFLMFSGEEAFYYFEGHVKQSLFNGQFVFMILGMFLFCFACKIVFKLVSIVFNYVLSKIPL